MWVVVTVSLCQFRVRFKDLSLIKANLHSTRAACWSGGQNQPPLHRTYLTTQGNIVSWFNSAASPSHHGEQTPGSQHLSTAHSNRASCPCSSVGAVAGIVQAERIRVGNGSHALVRRGSSDRDRLPVRHLLYEGGTTSSPTPGFL